MSDDREYDGDSAVETRQKSSVRKPRRYVVLLLNDDYTTMEFVIEVLESIFNKSPSEATAIMLKVHHEGQGVAGSYSREVAETKVEQVHDRAKAKGFPLRATFQPE
ncbi:MAG: ATP-dependent Clp protease adapter ClpS [Myxococcota bacterium]|jgi:ATP-dependent Clp protease adaptor protein ClpS|nr:ATP-dependent Clp protease adapter ClpS [Myxococcota bacterium]